MTDQAPRRSRRGLGRPPEVEPEKGWKQVERKKTKPRTETPTLVTAARDRADKAKTSATTHSSKFSKAPAKHSSGSTNVPSTSTAIHQPASPSGHVQPGISYARVASPTKANSAYVAVPPNPHSSPAKATGPPKPTQPKATTMVQESASTQRSGVSNVDKTRGSRSTSTGVKANLNVIAKPQGVSQQKQVNPLITATTQQPALPPSSSKSSKKGAKQNPLLTMPASIVEPASPSKQTTSSTNTPSVANLEGNSRGSVNHQSIQPSAVARQLNNILKNDQSGTSAKKVDTPAATRREVRTAPHIEDRNQERKTHADLEEDGNDDDVEEYRNAGDVEGDGDGDGDWEGCLQEDDDDLREEGDKGNLGEDEDEYDGGAGEDDDENCFPRVDEEGDDNANQYLGEEELDQQAMSEDKPGEQVEEEDEDEDDENEAMGHDSYDIGKRRDERFSSPAEPMEQDPESSDEHSNFSSQLDDAERRTLKGGSITKAPQSPVVGEGDLLMEGGEAVDDDDEQDGAAHAPRDKGKGKGHPLLGRWFNSLIAQGNPRDGDEEDEEVDGVSDEENRPPIDYDDAPYDGPGRKGRRSKSDNDSIRNLRNIVVRASHELGIPIVQLLKLMGLVSSEGKRKVSDWNLFQAFTRLLGLTDPSFAGLTAKELAPLFREVYHGISNEEREKMREKMMKDIATAARHDPDAQNIRDALKLKDDLQRQASVASANGFSEVISIMLCEDDRLSSVVVGHESLWDVIDNSDVLIRPVLGRMGAAVRALKAAIVQPGDIDVKAIFRGPSNSEEETQAPPPANAPRAQAAAAVPHNDDDEHDGSSPLLSQWYDPAAPCPQGMVLRWWNIPPGTPAAKLNGADFQYLDLNFPNLPIWFRNESEATRDCVDRLFRLKLTCMIQSAIKSTKPEARIWSDFLDILAQNQLCLVGYSIRSPGVPGRDFNSRGVRKGVTEPGAVEMLEGMAGIRKVVGGPMRVEEWSQEHKDIDRRTLSSEYRAIPIITSFDLSGNVVVRATVNDAQDHLASIAQTQAKIEKIRSNATVIDSARDRVAMLHAFPSRKAAKAKAGATKSTKIDDDIENVESSPPNPQPQRTSKANKVHAKQVSKVPEEDDDIEMEDSSPHSTETHREPHSSAPASSPRAMPDSPCAMRLRRRNEAVMYQPHSPPGLQPLRYDHHEPDPYLRPPAPSKSFMRSPPTHTPDGVFGLQPAPRHYGDLQYRQRPYESSRRQGSSMFPDRRHGTYAFDSQRPPASRPRPDPLIMAQVRQHLDPGALGAGPSSSQTHEPVNDYYLQARYYNRYSPPRNPGYSRLRGVTTPVAPRYMNPGASSRDLELPMVRPAPHYRPDEAERPAKRVRYADELETRRGQK
ncbi:hypothetical protein BKA70DRAFT_1431052 [Coprinopsis sp. MPI-PUGE-AT-0042]|nr:hypothetical protein BKA70DRAFT_1431052 [Coprinopsis sp. MPI-PUGE-AT-0042]